MTCFKPEGTLLPTAQNARILSSPTLLREACKSGTPLEGRAVLCDGEHNLHVDLGCMRGIIPKNEGALGIEDGSVRDIALISRVNNGGYFPHNRVRHGSEGRNICHPQPPQRAGGLPQGISLVARLRRCYRRLRHAHGAVRRILRHRRGDKRAAAHRQLSVSRIPHPNARFSTGQNIRAIVKSCDELGRITLSHRELLGTWEENSAAFKAGETVPGIVRSVEKYGIFVELTPNLAGLAEYCDGVKDGDHASVYIKSILPQRMKIKLVIVDSFSADYPPAPIKYFTDSRHIDSWVYSPEGCEKVIESVFAEENQI